MVTKSLQIFLNQILDYAGLYPPANLPLGEAIRNFAKYQSDSDVWMLSRFIIPAKRLPELSQFAEQIFSGGKVLSFSVLGRGGKDAEEFLENIQLDITNIVTFRDLHGANVLADMFEVALPASALMNQADALELVNKTTDVLNKNGLTVFFEVSFGEGWQARAEKLIRSLRKVKDKHVGFKLRTGGVTVDAFPSTEQIAWAIAATRDSGTPIKATAGLHHPVRHYNEGVLTKMHGFLNVFGAGVLAVTNDLSLVQIQSILEDEDSANFIFDEMGFAWKDIRVDIEQIELARRNVVSFGSCSFDEPREDLRKLGLLV